MSIASFLSSLSATEWAFLAYGCAVFALLAADLLLVGARKPVWTPHAVAAAFLLSSLTLLFFCRRHILHYDLIINPDEAMMAANAMLAQHGWLDWNLADTLTSGPLNSSILIWPYLLGGDITLYSTRLTGLVCVFGMASFVFLAVRRLAGDCVAIVAVSPVVLFLSRTSGGDFVHYSSEQLTMLLLAAAFYLFVRSFAADRLALLIAAGLVLGLVPYAKLQGAPVAAAAGLLVLARAIEIRARAGGVGKAARAAAAVIVAALLPTVVLLTPLVLAGGFNDFLMSYFVQQRLRIVRWQNPYPEILEGAKPASLRALLEAYGVILMASLLRFVVVIGTGSWQQPSKAALWSMAMAVVLVPVAFVAIATPGRIFYHYLLLFLPPAAILVGAALTVAGVPDGYRIWRHSVFQAVPLLAALLVIFFEIGAHHGDGHYRRYKRAFLEGRLLTAPHMLDWLRPTANDRIVCWGWQAECYVNSAMRPATRDVTNENQIYRTALKPYFRARFIHDFSRSRPDFVLDTVAPGSFGFSDPKRTGIRAFTKLGQIVASDFVRVSRVEPADGCPRLYVRRERLAELERSLIAFADISATNSVKGHTASALDDRSVVEACQNDWLLPDGALGAVTIDFDAPTPVRTVAIMNTRNEPPRSTRGIRLAARLGGVVQATAELRLEPYPYWTFYRFDEPVTADGLTIDILSYRGNGAGLSEIKAYRD